MKIQFEYFLLIRNKNCGCKIRKIRWFPFGMSHEIPAFEVHVFRSDLKF